MTAESKWGLMSEKPSGWGYADDPCDWCGGTIFIAIRIDALCEESAAWCEGCGAIYKTPACPATPDAPRSPWVRTARELRKRASG